MTTLPASGYWSDNVRTEAEGKQWGEDIRDVISELLGGAAATELTITSGGDITPTLGCHTVDTYGDAASDSLDNIITTNTPDGRLLLLSPENGSRTVVITDTGGGAGQIHLIGACSLTDIDQWILLKRTGADWYEITRSHKASQLERGGDDELDGDHLDIDWDPTYYTPDTYPSEAGNVDDLTAHLYGIDLAFAYPMRSTIQRAKFIRTDGNTLTIEPGIYGHHGTKMQIVYWNSDITFNLGSDGSNPSSSGTQSDLGDPNTWHYIYLDDSAIVSNGSPGLDATCFLNSTTAPSWSDVRHGWYNGSDRCIFAVKLDANASAQMREWIHDGGDEVFFAGTQNVMTGQDVDSAWEDLSSAISIPSFAIKCRGVFILHYGNATDYLSWRTNGQATDGEKYIGRVYDATGSDIFECVLITDSNHQIELKFSGDNTNTVDLYVNSWFLPTGM